ncbi:aspartyl protease family protein [Flavihumibacter profundi]|uniref:aspartyl protease family protein n=1 Tax=Flavihumibacter profundi TaxID=2716883 RepID=UPI001CC4794E|nr:aspartyl protease family protein [Flavihumibacter profundi]MBZ5858998.1 aspartyl protease family protein [Flavihumibacter profundi]
MLNKFTIALVTLFLVFNQDKAYSQEYFSPPPAQLLTDFPFIQFNGGVIMVRAKLDNYPDSLNFILDTGSGGISLDSGTVVNLKLPTVATDRTIRGIAGLKKVRFAYNHKLFFPGLTVDSLNFHINDYDILTSVYGEKIDGIIGFSFFSRYIVKLDYDTLRVFVYSKGTMKYPKGGHLLKPNLTSIPIISARIKDENIANTRYFFDTGAGLSLLLTDDFVNDSSLFSKNKKIFYTQAEGLGGKTNMKLTTVKEFRFGPYKFRKVPAYIFPDEYNVTNYPFLGGLVGNDLLRRFNVILNYDRRDIYLIPNNHFRDRFDYAYTGLGFYYINGQVTVTDIMKGSPAEKAGFLEGDIIIAINNNMTRNMQAYRSMVQQEGEKLKFVVIRKSDGKLIELYMKVGSILKK